MGARLTDRLLTFARRQRLETQSINLNEFVLSLTELLRRTIGTPIDLSTALAIDHGRPRPGRERRRESTPTMPCPTAAGW